MSEPRPSFIDLSARDIVDDILTRVTLPEHCYEESDIGSQLIPALAALEDHTVKGIWFSLKQRFGRCKDCKKSSTIHPTESCTRFTLGGCPDLDGQYQRWWGSIQSARSKLATEQPIRHREPSGLPVIEVTDKPLRDLSSQALAALHAKNSPPALFSRSGEMIHVAIDEQGTASLRTVTEDRLRGHMTRSADFYAAKKDSLCHISPPLDIVRDILAYSPAAWKLPMIRGVTEIPAMRPDGTILDKPGYDAATGLYYSNGTLEPIPVKESPTLDDVRAARATVEDAIGEFPFDCQASRANMYAMLLTPILRPAITGTVPLAVLDAPQAGTGKGLLADVVSLIATGREAPKIPYQWRDDEMHKQISACLWEGRPLICFDNLEGELRSPSLALGITARLFECRILGSSKNMLVENRAVWMVTGNNVKPGGDMPRRCYQIRIDAGDPNPSESREFRHPDLPQWITENRAHLLHALLTISRFWFARGCPEAKQGKPWGSFESWHRVIGGILRSAQIPGFLANRQVFATEEDDSPREWEVFLTEIDRHFPDAERGQSVWFTIQTILEQIQVDASRLHAARPSDVIDMMERGRRSPTIALGKLFQARRGRRFGAGGRQVWLERHVASSEHRGASLWRVRSNS